MERGDRQVLVVVIKDMLYSREITDVERLYVQARPNPVAVRLVRTLKTGRLPGDDEDS